MDILFKKPESSPAWETALQVTLLMLRLKLLIPMNTSG